VGQAVDRGVAVEIGGERVALRGGSDSVLDVGAGRGPQGGVERAAHPFPVHRLHGPSERRGDLQQVGHPPDVDRSVGAGAVDHRRVEERGVPDLQRQLHVVGFEVRRELRPVGGQVARPVLLRVRQVQRRPALQRHVRVRDRALQGEHRGQPVHVRRVLLDRGVGQEPEVVVAVPDLRPAARVDHVELRGHLVTGAEPGCRDQRHDVVGVVADEHLRHRHGKLLQRVPHPVVAPGGAK
jgi:hypothetical protein